MKNYQIVLSKTPTLAITSLAAAFLLAFGSPARAAGPVISGIYPNGTNQFQPSGTLSFTAASSVGVTNVTVALITTTLSGSSSYLQTLTIGQGLTATGPDTSESVSAALKTNTLYSATITATDSGGNSTSTSVSFDTIVPSYTWEAEDWDYTSNSVSGYFIDNPQVDKYFGLASTEDSDFNNTQIGSGLDAYRPQGLESEPNSDVPRLQYIGTTNLDYDVGYTATGEWGNYTRHYPAGLFNVYVRCADGNSTTTDAGELSVVSGSASFTTTGPYTYSVVAKGWQTYSWSPVIDASGNLAQLTVPNDGNTSTLRSTIDNGNVNLNFFMLVPANTNPPVAGPALTNIYPDGSVLFQPASALTFAASSTNGINDANITVQLSVTNLLGQSYVTNYTTANGMTVTGTSTDVSVSVPLSTNLTYGAFIQVIDGAGNGSSHTWIFDTITPSYTWEAEDFDYQYGQFIDNPQTNAYFDGGAYYTGNFNAIETVDILVAEANQHSFAYRGYANALGAPPALNTEPNGDTPRVQYFSTNSITGLQNVDYDVGYNSGGDWGQYTRHFPAGSYNVFMRGSNGGVNGPGNQGKGFVSLSLVTNGYATASETVSPLGQFTVYPTGNWQTYTWVPLYDQYGNLVKVTFDGTDHYTLRVTTLGVPTGGSYNANFYMLMPAVQNLPTINDIYPDGTAFFQSTNQLSFVVNSGAPIATNNVVVTLNGANATGLKFSPISSGWTVTAPLQLNNSYNLTIHVTDNAGQVASSALSFDTFQSSDYQFMAADFDYTSNGVSGLFFDNPQTNAYFGLPSTSGIDNVQSDQGANPFDYRTNTSLGLPPSTSPADDLALPQFATTGVDYNIGFFGGGSWCNFTRHYPAGTYNVWERYAEGAQNSETLLSMVTNGYGTSTQTTSLLGTFTNLVGGWSEWTWAPLTDTNGDLATVTFSGTNHETLQLEGSPVSGQPEVNVNFFLLTPAVTSGGAVTLTASVSVGSITISFHSLSGHTYQLQSNTSLTGGTWINVGSPVAGNGNIEPVEDTVGAGSRFYRVEVQ